MTYRAGLLANFQLVVVMLQPCDHILTGREITLNMELVEGNIKHLDYLNK